MHERPHDPCRWDSCSGTSHGEPQASVEDRKRPLVSVGRNRLVTPLLSSAMVLVSTAIAYPHPGQLRRSARRQVRRGRWHQPKLPRVFRADLGHRPRAFCVCAGHRPLALEPDDCQNRGSWDTPTGYIRKAPDRRFRWSEALSRTRWQVKDSNLRSSRDGFTVLGRQGCDQQKCLSIRQLSGVFPADSWPQPTTAGRPDAA
jgi:hypothetical protein